MEYTKTLGVKTHGKKTEITLSNNGFSTDKLSVDKDDILFFNRYVSVKSIVPEVVHTIVFKVGDNQVAKFDFVQNTDLKDTEFEDKLLFWVENENIRLEENDWNGFCPIVNGYEKLTYVDTEKTDENEPKTVNAIALGAGVAGVLITIFGGVMTGLGHIRFGVIGIVLGVVALIFGIGGIFKKK